MPARIITVIIIMPVWPGRIGYVYIGLGSEKGERTRANVTHVHMIMMMMVIGSTFLSLYQFV